jgi:hypothetical protein
MTKISRSVSAALIVGALVAGLSGCQKKEGPAEHVGKGIDKAVEKTDQQIDKSMEKAGDKMKDAAHD